MASSLCPSWCPGDWPQWISFLHLSTLWLSFGPAIGSRGRRTKMGRKRSESDYFNSLHLHSDLGCTQIQVLAGAGSSSKAPALINPWWQDSLPYLPTCRGADGSPLLLVLGPIPILAGSLNLAHTSAPAFHLFLARTLPDTAPFHRLREIQHDPRTSEDSVERSKIIFNWSYSFSQVISPTLHPPSHPTAHVHFFPTILPLEPFLSPSFFQSMWPQCSKILLKAWGRWRRTPIWSKTGNRLKLRHEEIP